MPPKLMSPGTHSSEVGKEAINKITSNSPGDECRGEADQAELCWGGEGGCAPVSHKGFSVNLSV